MGNKAMESSRPNESVPLSTEQEDYLRLGRDGHGVIPVCFRVHGKLDISAIQRALSQVLSRHESLRLRLVDTPDGLRQVFPPVAAEDRAIREITAPSGSTAADVARQLANEPADARAHGPVRTWMIRSGTDDTLLLILIDHLAIDGWCTPIFIEEFWTCYLAAIRGTTPVGVLTKPVRQYSSHIAEQQERASAWAPGQYEYWQRVIRDYCQPTERTRQAATVGSPDQPARSDIVCNISPEQLSRLAGFAQAVGVPTRAVELAGVALALWAWCPAAVTRIWSEHSGREDPAIANAMGIYYRLVPVVTRIDPAATLAEFTRKVVSDWSDAAGYSGMPYSQGAIRRQIAQAGGASPGVPEVALNRVILARPSSTRAIQLSDSTTIEVHRLLAEKWAWYREPRLRIQSSAAESLSMRAVFNPGITSPGFAETLMDNLAALLALFVSEHADHPVGELTSFS